MIEAAAHTATVIAVIALQILGSTVVLTVVLCGSWASSIHELAQKGPGRARYTGSEAATKPAAHTRAPGRAATHARETHSPSIQKKAATMMNVDHRR